MLRAAIFLLITSSIKAQVAPLDALHLSGAFGEPRGSHFHAGWDLTTGEQEGAPVYAIDSGSVYRLRISPYGYGRAVYLRHPDGTFSVYAHLYKFAPELEAYIQSYLQRHQRNTADLYLPDGKLIVRKGQLIGFSGTSGSSTGPHLHFEVRSPDEAPVRPSLKGFQIKDTLPSRFKWLRFFKPYQWISDSDTFYVFPVPEFTLTPSRLQGRTVPWPYPALVLGFKGYDRTGQRTTGLSRWFLIADGDTLFHYRADTLPYPKMRLATAIQDRRYILLWMPPAVRHPSFQTERQGVVLLKPKQRRSLQVGICDEWDQCQVLSFSVKYVGNQSLPSVDSSWLQLRDTILHLPPWELQIDASDLWTPLPLRMEACRTAPQCVEITPFVPLREKANLRWHLPTLPDSLRPYVYVQQVGAGRNVYVGKWQADTLQVAIRRLGRFVLRLDTIPPRIRLPQQDWQLEPYLVLNVHDDETGIYRWDLWLDNQWYPSEYYPSLNQIRFFFPTPPTGRMRQLRVRLADRVGNVTERTFSIRY